ncbi:hypothetical protein OAN22_01100 [Alphaproteobacteria bacterium]|nr:hypothetical protein [Alphaproteobacteria bacterium]
MVRTSFSFAVFSLISVFSFAAGQPKSGESFVFSPTLVSATNFSQGIEQIRREDDKFFFLTAGIANEMRLFRQEQQERQERQERQEQDAINYFCSIMRTPSGGPLTFQSGTVTCQLYPLSLPAEQEETYKFFTTLRDFLKGHIDGKSNVQDPHRQSRFNQRYMTMLQALVQAFGYLNTQGIVSNPDSLGNVFVRYTKTAEASWMKNVQLAFSYKQADQLNILFYSPQQETLFRQLCKKGLHALIALEDPSIQRQFIGRYINHVCSFTVPQSPFKWEHIYEDFGFANPARHFQPRQVVAASLSSTFRANHPGAMSHQRRGGNKAQRHQGRAAAMVQVQAASSNGLPVAAPVAEMSGQKRQ